ncbi:hypothetical protein JW707_02130 [Candidatus Woesearchaeota archaeon]|nr:hypothetical protein [Candidatus Woesearchaeota archaeon]
MTIQNYEDLNSQGSNCDYGPAKGAIVLTAFVEDAEDMAALEAVLNEMPVPKNISGEPTSFGKIVAEALK